MSLDLSLPLAADQAVSDVLAVAGLPARAAEVQMISHGRSGDLVAQVGARVVKLAPADRPHNIALLRQEIEVMRWLGECQSRPAFQQMWKERAAEPE